MRLDVPGNALSPIFTPDRDNHSKEPGHRDHELQCREAGSPGEAPITDEHVRTNTDVRDLLVKRGIKPGNPASLRKTSET